MFKYKRIKVGKKFVEAALIKLLSNNFILFRGGRGYIMCGYLDMKVAEKFKDVAAKVVGVSSIEQTLKSAVHSCTSAAARLGVYKGQSVKEALKIIA